MTRKKRESTPAGTDAEVAAYWALRLDADDCDALDRAAFEGWYRDKPENAKAYVRARRTLDEVDRHRRSHPLRVLGDQVLHATSPHRRVALWPAASAAAAVLFLVVGAFLYQRAFLSATPEPVRYTSETTVGGRSVTRLADGSTVTLNTDTRIDIQYDRKRRGITLMRGQALFEVVEDERPFEVIAGNRRIVALGTAFDVRMQPDNGVQVTLLEGRLTVAVLAPEAPPEVRAENPQPTVFNMGEQLVVSNAAPARITPADVEQVTGWRDGLLIFREETLPEAVSEINRYSTRQISLEQDRRLQELTVNGVFETGRTESFVRAMEVLYPITSRQLEEDRVVLLWTE